MLLDFARVARNRVRDGRRQFIFSQSMRALLHNPAAAAENEDLLSDLVYGWGNAEWSGAPELLKCCLREALVAQGPILECGSGLTTLLLGVVAQRTGNEVWTLEHLPEWAERVSVHMAKFGINSVHLCAAPLVDLGEYRWYSPPPEARSRRFDLVVCDGPPASTVGGRYGLLPVMRQSLGEGCVILLDDAEREGEQVIVGRWCTEMTCKCSRMGVNKPFFRIVVDDCHVSRMTTERPAGGQA